MRVFVSGKIGGQANVRWLMATVRANGHEITFDWTQIAHLRPYLKHREEAAEAALLEVNGVRDADALILEVHERGVGMFVELGVALAMAKPVIAISKGEPPSMFLCHPLVTRVESAQAAIDAIEALSRRDPTS